MKSHCVIFIIWHSYRKDSSIQYLYIKQVNQQPIAQFIFKSLYWNNVEYKIIPNSPSIVIQVWKNRSVGRFGRRETLCWSVKQDFILLADLNRLVWFILKSNNVYYSSFEENIGMTWIFLRVLLNKTDVFFWIYDSEFYTLTAVPVLKKYYFLFCLFISLLHIPWE